jgi:hypothetical protein
MKSHHLWLDAGKYARQNGLTIQELIAPLEGLHSKFFLWQMNARDCTTTVKHILSS